MVWNKLQGELRPWFFSLGAAVLLTVGPFHSPANSEWQTPASKWQTPGAFQTPGGHWQTPGALQVPKGIRAVHVEKGKTSTRIRVGADALFAFDKSDLNPDAEQTLNALGPQITKVTSGGKFRLTIEGHTDSKGTDSYNQKLSLARATTVRDWLVRKNYIKAGTGVRGFAARQPVAPNTHRDGSDDPKGRQKNRRVEVLVESL